MDFKKKAILIFALLFIVVVSFSIYTSLVLRVNPKVWVSLALADSINPCEVIIQATIGISVAISSTITRGFLISLLYAFGVVTSYFFLGMGLSIIAVFIPTWVAGSIAIIYGGYNLVKSYLTDAEESCPTCVERGKEKLYFLNWGFLGAYALGLLIGLTISPCTIGPYPIFLTMIKELSFLHKTIALLAYNLIFGTPLFIISFIISLTEISTKTQLLITRNYKKLKIASSLIMLIIGTYILYLYHP